jgi:sortase B
MQQKGITVLIILCGIGCCVAGALFWLDYREGFEPDRLAALKPSLPAGSSQQADWDNGNGIGVTMNFDKLKALNSDVAGWLTLEGTLIDYPVVQSKDNDYYLRHTIEKKPSKTGALFLDYRIRGDFSDFNTIIYGHNLKSERMFGTLARYSQESWFRTHRTGWLYTAEGKRYRLTVIGCLQTTAESYVYEFGFPSPSAKKEHIAKLKENALVWDDGGMDLSRERLLTLSTCSNEEKDSRTVVIVVISGE